MLYLHNYANWMIFKLKNPNIRTKSEFMAALVKLMQCVDDVNIE